MAELKHFTKAGFDAAMDGDMPVLVDFWATWCGPCRMVAPVIEELAARYDGKLIVGKVDVDAEQELSVRYGVMSIPTVVLFKGGKEVQRLIGAMPVEAYAEVIDANL